MKLMGQNFKIQFMFILLGLMFGVLNAEELQGAKPEPFTPVQKLVDPPKDTAIKVYTSIDTYCYVPYVAQSGTVYLMLDFCSKAPKARYDVFGRLGYEINQTWLCITAPDSVAISRKRSDYVTLRPCVINNKSQQWQLKDGIFYATDNSYTLKDDGTYIYAALTRDTSLKAHILHKDMQSWVDTIAQPMNLSIETFIAWDLNTKDGSERYFLKNNSSDKNTTTLFYNLESGHISTFASPNLQCMYSDNQGYEWNWVWWDKCTDVTDDARAIWRIITTKEREIAFLNVQNNALRLTRYGIHWGVPYTASASYIQGDSANSPVSSFAVSNDWFEWQRFLALNNGKNLDFCPAPDKRFKRVKRDLNPAPLPSTFLLSPQWRERLRAIINTTNGSRTGVGVCGICLLQSFQIIAEILENPQTPRTSGGYFFDTQEGANPFASFERRNSILYATLDDILTWYRLYIRRGTLVTEELITLNSNNMAMATAISMLPQYDWNIPVVGLTQAQINGAIDRLLNAPNGSLFILLMDIQTQGRSGSHAMVAIRAIDGLHLIPTNVMLSAFDFQEATRAIHTREEFLNSFHRYGFSLISLSLLQVSSFHPSFFANVISVNNCAGEGGDRRGSGSFPSSQSINQCPSGRCLP